MQSIRRAYGGEPFKDQPTVLATDLGGNVVPSVHGPNITMSLFQNKLDGRLCGLNSGKLAKLAKHQSKLCSVSVWLPVARGNLVNSATFHPRDVFVRNSSVVSRV